VMMDTASPPNGSVPKAPISAIKRYQFVTQQLRYHNEKIIEAFKLFIKLFSAIVGGAIWLSIQTNELSSYGNLALALVGVLTLVTVVMVISNLMAWYGFRKAESFLVGKEKVGPPTPIRSCWTEYVMIFAMVCALTLFWCFNPLRSRIIPRRVPTTQSVERESPLQRN
jgi:hypothetical protein